MRHWIYEVVLILKPRVNRKLKIANPPAKPLMLYDGDCKFCTLWIHRWQLATGNCVEYLPFQNPQGSAKYPEIPRENFVAAVQLIMPDGSVFSAAEAVCQSLACNPEETWLLDLYRHSPVFVWISETGYHFVARHRTFFSWVTRLLWGRHLEPPQQNLVRGIFLRSMGIIFLTAFISLWMQIADLAGSHGKVPVAVTMNAAKQMFAAQSIGLNRYHLLPTLCWFSTSDGFLNLQCAAGTALGVLLIAGVAPALCLFLLWLIYLSLTTVCTGPAEFQWSNLLLETGFLAIFFAPLQWLPRRSSEEASPSRIALWLLRWLLFRVMFASGGLKFLTSHGIWLKLVFDAAIFGFDYLLPFAIFLPRKPRQVACIAFVASQILLLFTSNHHLFNLLVMSLCLMLLDDAAIKSLLPNMWKPRPVARHLSIHRWPTVIELALLACVICASYTQFFKFAGLYMPGPEPVLSVNHWLQPFRTFNSYREPP